MGGAMEHGPLVGPSQGGASSPIDHDGNRIREIAVAAADRAENTVGANPPDMHDAAGSRGLGKLRRGCVSVDGLREGDGPGRKRRVTGREIGRVEPYEVDAARTPSCDPGKVVRPLVVVDLHRRRPSSGLVAGVSEPN